MGLGLPGTGKSVFADDNFELVFSGTNLISKITESKIRGQKNKNIYQKVKGQGDITFRSLDKYEDLVKLAGEKGDFDLYNEYKVAKSLLPGFDITTQLAIASGLEALKDAGIPLVMDESREFGLPESMRDETGVIFASTFPVLDSILNEQRQYYEDDDYRFDRKYLLKAMPLAHGHFAQIVKARGPNTHVNVACASTAQAIAIAQDWIRLGRCRRVVILSADDASSDEVFQWVGTGFLAAGAATTEENVEKGARPFDVKRSGMILGMGAAAMVIETLDAAKERGISPSVELVHSYYANSAYHGMKVDRDHVKQSLSKFLEQLKNNYSIDRDEIAKSCVYFSHETYTPPQGNAARAEIEALVDNFNELTSEIVVTNTKGITAHPMGVGIEDVVLVRSLETGRIPPVVNLQKSEFENIRYSKGEKIKMNYGLHFAAGFGSQFVYLLYRRISEEKKHTSMYEEWLKKLSQDKELSMMGKTLILK